MIDAGHPLDLETLVQWVQRLGLQAEWNAVSDPVDSR